MIYFSILKGKPILDLNGRIIGSLQDLTFIYEGKFPKITSFITIINGEKRIISEKFVEKYDKQIHLNTPFAKVPIEVKKEQDNELSIMSNLLDMQIVDTEGMKVVRVNDVILSVKEGIFCITSVDVGFKGFLRRLGFDKFLEKFVFFKKMKEQVIPWEFVAPLEIGKKNIQLNVPKTKLSSMHPADLADIMEDLSHRERAMIFRNLDEGLAAKTLKESNLEVQQSAFKTLKPRKIAELLEELSPEEAADLVERMPKDKAREILGLVNRTSAEDIKEMMGYEKDSAGGLMSTQYIAISSSSSVEEVLNFLRASSPDSKHIYYIYVVSEDNILCGVLPLRNLIISNPKERIENVMNKNVINVHINDTKEDVANLLSKYDLLALPVVNEKGQLEGIVRTDFILEEVIPKKWKEKIIRKRRITKKKAENKTETKSENKNSKN